VTGRYASLKNITHPTQIVHGNNDVVVAPIKTLILDEAPAERSIDRLLRFESRNAVPACGDVCGAREALL